jgi:hypothetical protein
VRVCISNEKSPGDKNGNLHNMILFVMGYNKVALFLKEGLKLVTRKIPLKSFQNKSSLKNIKQYNHIFVLF